MDEGIDTAERKNKPDGSALIDRLVMLPPHVAKEHRKLLDDAERLLNDYSELLLSRIEKDIKSFKFGHWSTHEAIAEAQNVFLSDPVRQQMVRNLGEIKMLVERPQFLVRTT